MRMHTHLWKSVLGKAALATVALGGFLFFGGAPSAQAHDRDRDDYRHERYENWRRHEAFEHRHDYDGYWRHERGWWQDRYGCWHRY